MHIEVRLNCPVSHKKYSRIGTEVIWHQNPLNLHALPLSHHMYIRSSYKPPSTILTVEKLENFILLSSKKSFIEEKKNKHWVPKTRKMVNRRNHRIFLSFFTLFPNRVCFIRLGISVPVQEDEEVFLNPPSVNKLFSFNLFRWDNTVLGFFCALIDIFIQSCEKLCQRLLT